MKIATDSVVTIEFTLRSDDGEVRDASDDEPFVYLHGHGELVPGLEKRLEGQSAGATLQVEVPPAEGFGERESELVTQVARAEWPADVDIALGDEVDAEGPDGEALTMWIAAVDDDAVHLDANHPLAGQTLHFDVKVLEVRPASPDELLDADGADDDAGDAS